MRGWTQLWIGLWIVACVIYGLVVAWVWLWALETTAVAPVTDAEFRRELPVHEDKLISMSERPNESPPDGWFKLKEGALTFFVAPTANAAQLRQALERASSKKTQGAKTRSTVIAFLVWLVPCLAPLVPFATFAFRKAFFVVARSPRKKK